jgi:hypothetical protein
MSTPVPDPRTCTGCDTTYDEAEQARDCEQTHTGPLTAHGARALIAKRIY